MSPPVAFPVVHLSRSVSSGRASVANLQHETAATNARPSGTGCAYSRLARHERRSPMPAPPLCKQWVGVRVPLAQHLRLAERSCMQVVADESDE
jgi:hypothetical protein